VFKTFAGVTEVSISTTIIGNYRKQFLELLLCYISIQFSKTLLFLSYTYINHFASKCCQYLHCMTSNNYFVLVTLALKADVVAYNINDKNICVLLRILFVQHRCQDKQYQCPLPLPPSHKVLSDVYESFKSTCPTAIAIMALFI